MNANISRTVGKYPKQIIVSATVNIDDRVLVDHPGLADAAIAAAKAATDGAIATMQAAAPDIAEETATT